ncbi:unnamed protein product [Camellia sinensis]
MYNSVHMEIVSSNRLPLDHHAEEEEEEEDGGGVKVLETKLKELRFDQEEPGLGHSSFGLKKKLLRLEFKVITGLIFLTSFTPFTLLTNLMGLQR